MKPISPVIFGRLRHSAFLRRRSSLNAAFDILHTQNPACVCEISVIFFVFRYTLGLPQAPPA